jgi:DNA polymerase zeta
VYLVHLLFGQILERSIKLLFTTSNVSLVKKYVQRQFTKLMTGSASLQDFIFAKEYRGVNGYQPGACVPALQIARYLYFICY